MSGNEITPSSTGNKLVIPQKITGKEALINRFVSAEERQRIREKAKRDMSRVIRDSAALMSYGSGNSVKQLDQLSRQIVAESGRTKPPEMSTQLRAFDKSVRGFRAKYNTRDPKVARMIRKGKTTGLAIFGGAKDLVTQIKKDFATIEQSIDIIEQQGAGHQHQAQRALVFCDEMRDRLQKTMLDIMREIAQMQELRNCLVEHAQSIKVDEDDISDRGTDELTDTLSAINTIDRKLTNLIGSVWHRRHTTALVRMMSQSAKDSALDLDELQTQAVPAIRLNYAVWLQSIANSDAAKYSNSVKDLTNAATLSAAEAVADSSKAVAEASQRPVFSPETLEAVTELYIQSSDHTLEAFRQGNQARADMERAVIESMKAVKAKDEETAAAMLEELAKQAGVELEIGDYVDYDEVEAIAPAPVGRTADDSEIMVEMTLIPEEGKAPDAITEALDAKTARKPARKPRKNSVKPIE